MGKLLMTAAALDYASEGESFEADPEGTIAAFLRYHATDGREELVERVARCLFVPQAAAYLPGFHWEHYRSEAEAVVAALFDE